MPLDVPIPGVAERAAALTAAHAGHTPERLLSEALSDRTLGRTALVSSFGAESIVLLHMVAQIDLSLPVLFVDTGLQFPETLSYQREVTEFLGLRGLRIVTPDREALLERDPDGILYQADPDGCCALRKTEPLQAALKDFDTWITGRKRYQGGQRIALPLFEAEEAAGRIKINPLAHWDGAEVVAYMTRHDLPRHPLVDKGYRSIGCAPCTVPTGAHEDPRAGRWRGQAKTECGIHFVGGRAVPGPGPGSAAALG